MIWWKYTVWTLFRDIPCEHDQMIAYQVNMIQWQHTKWTWSTDSIPNDPDPIRAYWTNMICWGHAKWTWSIEDIITEWLWSYEYIHSEDDLMRTYWVNIIWWEHTEWTWSDDSIPSEYDEDKPSQHNVCHHTWQNTPVMPRYWKSLLLSLCYIYKPTFLVSGLIIINSVSTHPVCLQKSVVQKIQDWQTFNQVLSHHCHHVLEHYNVVFATKYTSLWWCPIKPCLVAKGSEALKT